MIKYFLLFSLLGFLVAKIAVELRTIIFLYLLIAVIWGIFTAPIWGFVSLGELFLGYSLKMILDSKG
jgi:hypothetical protein